MSRFSRINTIWRKELIDTLRDRRTVVAMVLVPMVLYPALILGSLQGFEVQRSQMLREEYFVGVQNEEARAWLRRLIDTDAVRQSPAASGPAEALIEQSKADPSPPAPGGRRRTETVRAGVRQKPPEYKLFVVPDVPQGVVDGRLHVGVLLDGPPPTPEGRGSTAVQLVFDESEIRSEIASAGLQGILERAANRMVLDRLRTVDLAPQFIQPITLSDRNVASAERMAGSALGQIVPLILIMMTITGAIYPAIDLTAGERERGTLETLMVAPVPTFELITGKFIVVTAIGMLSAVLNLVSIGGTVYLGGLGELLTQGQNFVFPLSALPWILILLLPLAVMFSAMLLAVCSFARSFKEAQNYVVPVMIAAMIPGVVGVLPGTRLEGPIMVMPVANIVVLTRDLFMGRFDLHAILWVLLSTCLYAGAAIAIAARLFGQEAVLFSDAGSIKTMFQRRFFKPAAAPSAAAALLLLAIFYTLNFYIQGSIGSRFGLGLPYLAAVALTLVTLLGLGPLCAAIYLRLRVPTTFALAPPRAGGVVAALCFGCSTWILGLSWATIQKRWFPPDPLLTQQLEQFAAALDGVPLWTLLFLMALVPAVVEEWFFRGFVVSGLRSAVGKGAAVLIAALAFGLYHYMAQKLVITTVMGLLLGLLAVQYRSIWPPMLAHFLNNAFGVLAGRADGLAPWLRQWGFETAGGEAPAAAWALGAALLAAAGVLICLLDPQRDRSGPMRTGVVPESARSWVVPASRP